MAKHWFYILSFLFILSCGKTPKEIPEEKLGEIIADIVLTDSYVNNIMKPGYRERDTIDYFNPILDKYGYTIEDLEYTIDKYARRKTDVIWNTLDKATARVDVIRSIYDNNNKMREKWNLIVSERSADTLYYHKDTIYIKSASDLNKLILKQPIRNRGKFTVSYDYKMNAGENNESKYLIYYLSDTINKATKPYRNSFWIAPTTESDDKRTTKRVINAENIRRHNFIKIIPFDYSNYTSGKPDYKRMDTKIWDLLITFTPDPRDADKKVLLEDNPYPFIIDAKSQYEDRFENALLTPYSFKTLGIEIDKIKTDSL